MNCSACNQDIDVIRAVFENAKEAVPRNRHYIFQMYEETKSKGKLCLECFTKVVLMFQK